jgi:predicted DNA-binding protein with PD1-like motif
MSSLVREAKFGKVIVARLEHKKEIIAEIKEICKKKGIKSGFIPTLIGGLAEAELISMKYADVKYENKKLKHTGPFEVKGVGTIAMDGDEVSPHIHIVLGKYGNECVSGHLVSGKIALFIEVVIIELKGVKMIKKVEPEIFGLKLLNFEEQ